MKKTGQFNTFQSCQSSLLETRLQETKEQSQPWSPTELRSRPATAKTLNSHFINEISSESISHYAKKEDSLNTWPRRLRVAWKYAELAPTIINRAQITWIPIIGKKDWHQVQFFFSVKSKSYLCHSALNMEWRGGLRVEGGGRTRCCWSEMCLECIGFNLMLIKCL